jgi:DNA replication and repair protein RecF
MLKKILLQNFRVYKFAEISCGGVNAILGQNGMGKTSVLEAISLLDGSSGIRGAEISDIPFFGGNGFEAGFEFTSMDISLKYENSVKSYHVDGDKATAKSLGRAINIIGMIPHDDLIFSNGRSKIRDFFDRIFSYIAPEHEKNIAKFKSLASERIKIILANGGSAWLSGVEKQMSELLCIIAYDRIECVKKVSTILQTEEFSLLPAMEISISGYAENLLLSGKTFGELEIMAVEMFAKSRFEDARTGRTQNGISSVEFTVKYGDSKINGIFCSSGEQKIIVASLFLVIAKIVSSSNKKTIILLDDILAKLDLSKQSMILNLIFAIKIQTFITSVSIDSSLSFQSLNTIDITKYL